MLMKEETNKKMGGFTPSDICAVAVTPPLAGCLATREMQFSDSATVLRLQKKEKKKKKVGKLQLSRGTAAEFGDFVSAALRLSCNVSY